MNQERRNRLDRLASNLEGELAELQAIAEDEREAFDNLPDSLQGSERGEAMDESAETLEELVDDLQGVIDRVREKQET